MPRTSQWTPGRERRELESWLNNNEIEFYRDTARPNVEELLKTGDPQAILRIAIRLERIALWETQSGCAAILRGDACGWKQLRLGYAYRSWRVRIHLARYERDGMKAERLEHLLDHKLAVCCLAEAIAFQDDAFADWAGVQMLEGAPEPASFFCAWQKSPFYRFMARLYALWRGRDSGVKKEHFQQLGIYQPIFDGWKDDDQYAAGLRAACDYHCKRTNCGATGDTEFWQPPFRLFPAEIHATQRVRAELIGSVPTLHHPLLDTPFGEMPKRIGLPRDKLLARVIARARKDLPGGTEHGSLVSR